jgi:uracil-DNA glycosylase
MKEQYLQALGIERWVLRQPAQKQAEKHQDVAAANVRVPETDHPSTMNWESLARCVADCTKCNLHGGRTQTVFGVGNRAADWMIIGEAPGAEEDARGEPFVGRAGQLLNAMLQAIGLQRQQVYIANILKCRPPNNRDPLPEEVQQCWPYLKRQIELIGPKVILAVGRIAAQNILMSEETIGRLRGKIHMHAESGVPVVATYHPAYLLRKPADKRKAWEDLQLACRALRQAHS